MWIEIFKTGTHVNSAGNIRTWTENDLDTIIENTTFEEHEPPVVIGHPDDNKPAYGWVEKLKREGNVLKAKLKQLVPEFSGMIKQGLFKKRSASFYPDKSLRHIGFLGAMPPSVKGLKDIEFSEEEPITYYEVDIDNYKEETMDKERELEIRLNEKETQLSKVSQNLSEKEKEIASFSENEKKKEEEIAKLRSELENERTEKRKSEHESFYESLEKEGRLTPAMKTKVIDFMEVLHSVGEYNFSEGGKKIALEVFKEFLKRLPKQVDYSEQATKERAQTDKEKAKEVKEMSGKELSELYNEDKARFDEIVANI